MSSSSAAYSAVAQEQDHERHDISRPSSLGENPSSSTTPVRNESQTPQQPLVNSPNPPQENERHENTLPKLPQAQIHPAQEVAAVNLNKKVTEKEETIEDHRRNAKQRTCSEPLKDWWPELLCTLSIFLALLATVLTLALHQNQPLPQWPFSVGVNALESVYIVISKSSILLIVSSGISQLKWHWFTDQKPLYYFERFDAASRGPLGASKLLWALRFRDLTTSLAAVIIISALAIDPFAQQLIRYYSCDEPDLSAFGEIPRANSFQVAGQHVEQRGASQAMDPGMLAAIAGGFLDTTEKSSVVPVNCVTGNCTFGNFQSIGLCTKCRDSTPLVETVCNVTGLTITHNFTGSTLNIRGFLAPPGIMAGGQQAMVTSIELSSWSFEGVDVIGGINVLALTNNKTEQATPKMIPASGKSVYCSRQGAFAAECGDFKETLIDTEPLLAVRNKSSLSTPWSPTYPGPRCFGMIRSSCLTEAQKNNVTASGTPVSNTPDWVPFCNSAAFGISPECYFELSQPSYYMLTGYFSSTLGSVSRADTRIFNGSVVAQNLTNSWSTVSGSAFLQNLYQSGNVNLDSYSTRLNRTVKSMTAFMRQNGAEGTLRPKRGRLVNTTTCVKVQWGWFALPATLGLLTSILLAVTIYISSFRSKGFVWKSSSLAMLFHGLNLGKEGMESDVGSDSAMVRTAKGMRVKMDEDGINSRLLATDDTKNERSGS